MILQVFENEKEKVLNCLKDDPSRALFIVGDILNYGMHRDFQDVWIDEDENGIHGIYLRYRNNFVFYVIDEVKDQEGLLKLIQDERIHVLSSTKSHMDKLGTDILAMFDFRETFFCECRSLKKHESNAIRATINDVEELVDNLMSINEFNLDKRARKDRIEDMRLDFLENDKVVYVLKENDKIVSAASASAQSENGVMVVAVYTLENYRNRGYARQVVFSLTQWALVNKLVPCLFYDNLKAGQLYHDLGYETFDIWVMGVKKS